MNKYRVKFSHMIQMPVHNQTNMLIKVVNVDEVYEAKSHGDILTLIHSRFNVISGITIIELKDEKISMK